MKKTIYDFDYKSLETWFVEHGEKPYRAKQVFQWLYQKRVSRFEEMSDLKKTLIEQLESEFCINPLTVKTCQISRDGTRKYLFELADGQAIETVLMVLEYGNSVCVTTQVGCNMGCTFCASGLIKKKRDLTSGEIVAHVMAVQNELKEERVSHIVVMGIGEPFDNYDHLMQFLRTVNHNNGMAIGARHITVSTCGIVPRIYDFSNEPFQFNLAISLHAPNDQLRTELMPINQAYPLKTLMEAMAYYSQKSNRKITFEYILLKGVNDQAEHAKQLANLVRGLNAYINLIPYNPVLESRYQALSKESALKFYDALKKQGINCTLRQEHGRDIDAACGQLRAKSEGILS